jgi:SagB-type dehydrogenase family enzyme
VYRYHPQGHDLEALEAGDRRRALADATFGQLSVGEAPATVLIAAVFERTTRKYGERGIRYVHMEAGHAAQNILLECTALGLATVPMGAFHDGAVHRAAGLPGGSEPLYLLPVGYPTA